MDILKDEVNQRLIELLNPIKEGKVKEAMNYSLMAPGKRLRPLLFLTTLKAYGMDYHPYLDIACAIEMIHTYSLIHDDLPGMDNDDLRRGRPTCHKQFDEATAILAGDALLNYAMSTVLNVKMDNELKIDILTRLFDASGVNGMIYGQQQDLYFENKQANVIELQDIHKHKTGELIAVGMQLAALIAKKSDYEIWSKVGFDLGLAFQIQDDILDVTSDSKTLGKNIGSDIENNKSTYVSLLGIEESQKRVDELFKKCYENIYAMQINHGVILELITIILKRVN
ncbi:MAG: polyprenyl synthetase family protein [Erysipelotrichaceae bacterium]|nr:polyprenyl synthetase family protein [Erysipelotrichaceae bacterium]